MNLKPRTILVLLGIFLAGMVTGSVATLGFLRSRISRRPGMERFAARQAERLNAELNLTPEQRARVEQLLQQTGEELSKLRHQSWAESAERIRVLNEKIAALLTPEQKPKFLIFQKEQEERMESMRHGHPGGHPPGPPFGPPPPNAPPGTEPSPENGPRPPPP